MFFNSVKSSPSGEIVAFVRIFVLADARSYLVHFCDFVGVADTLVCGFGWALKSVLLSGALS